MKITKDLMNQGKSSRNGWNHEQLRLLGVEIPLQSGWYKRLIGSEVEKKAVDKFLELKNSHLKKTEEFCPCCGQLVYK